MVLHSDHTSESLGELLKKTSAQASTQPKCGLQASSTLLRGNLLEIQILRPHPRPSESEILKGGPNPPFAPALWAVQMQLKFSDHCSSTSHVLMLSLTEHGLCRPTEKQDSLLPPRAMSFLQGISGFSGPSLMVLV